MPLYEFECSTCKTTVEALRSLDRRDEPLTCPKCVLIKKEPQYMTRSVGNFSAIIFKKPYC